MAQWLAKVAMPAVWDARVYRVVFVTFSLQFSGFLLMFVEFEGLSDCSEVTVILDAAV